jgi:hypothetical protein
MLSACAESMKAESSPLKNAASLGIHDNVAETATFCSGEFGYRWGGLAVSHGAPSALIGKDDWNLERAAAGDSECYYRPGDLTDVMPDVRAHTVNLTAG